MSLPPARPAFGDVVFERLRRLLQIPKLAFHPRAITTALFATLAVMLWQLPFQPKYSDAELEAVESVFGPFSSGSFGNERTAFAAGLFLTPPRLPAGAGQIKVYQGAWPIPLGAGARTSYPLHSVLHSFLNIGNGPSVFVGTVRTVGLFMLWAVFGAAMCRYFARQIADRPESLRVVLAAAPRDVWYALTYLAIPLAAVILLLFLYAGILVLIGGIGMLAAVMTSPILVLILVVVGALIAGLLFAWPLAAAAIGVEGSDGFDALSRSLSYFVSGFWIVAFGGAVAAALGTIAFIAFDFVLFCGTSALVQMAVALIPARRVDDGVIPVLGWLVLWIKFALSASWFWASTTMIYLFAREQVDGVPFDYTGAFDRPGGPRDPFPVVGMAASPPAAVTPPPAESPDAPAPPTP